MSQLFLTEKEIKESLFPFSLIRPVADIRIGILTIREKWEALLRQEIHLEEEGAARGDALIVPANIIPSKIFAASLATRKGLFSGDPDRDTARVLQYPWHIFMWNDWALRQDFDLLTSGRVSAPIPETVMTVDPQHIFIEEGAVLSHCIINASAGPVYIGRKAQIMDGALIRGPVAVCEGAVVKMGAKIYGATTIGPYSVVGGEVKNSVIFGYSNKSHDGYLGDSVIGEWCNLGAGTSNSNLKNTAGEVRVWSQPLKDYIGAGIKCGLLMGDYSRSAINTSFNTGTTVGICSNVFGEGLTPKFIPNFAWGSRGALKYELEKALKDANNWKKLKNAYLSEQEKTQLKLIFEQS